MHHRSDPDAMEMAVALLTAWRSPDDDPDMIRATLRGDVTPSRLVAALLELAAGLVGGAEISVGNVFRTRELLEVGLRRVDAGDPIRPDEVGADAVSAIRRAGLAVAARTIT